MRKQLFPITCLLLCIKFGAIAQTNVNHTTGAVDVNIGLFTLQGRTMDFPVSIKYNTRGLKVNDVASSIGLGWSMEGVGAVVRVQHGLADEMRTSTSGQSIPGGWLQANDCLVTDNFVANGNPPVITEDNRFSFPPLIQSIANASTLTTSQENQVKNGIRDLQPDEFYVNAPGLTGKFVFGVDDRFMNEAYQWQHLITYQGEIEMDQDPALFIPYMNCKVEYTRDLNHILSFIISNESGVKYYFEQPQFVSGSPNVGYTGYYESVSSWLLTKIEDVNGNVEMECTYQEGQWVQTVTAGGTRAIKREGQVNTEVWDNDYSFESAPCRWPRKEVVVSNVKMRIMDLVDIRTPHQKLVFVRNTEREDLTGDHMLDEVHYFFQEELVSKALFSHDYFESTIVNSVLADVLPQDVKRLRLKKLQFFSALNEPQDNPYQFEYDALALPVRNSASQDYWGYYNGQNDNKGLSCMHPFTDKVNSTAHADRTVGAGNPWGLKKIVMPSGGSETLNFENHTYDRIENEEAPNHVQYEESIVESDVMLLHAYYTSNTIAYETMPLVVSSVDQAIGIVVDIAHSSAFLIEDLSDDPGSGFSSGEWAESGSGSTFVGQTTEQDPPIAYSTSGIRRVKVTVYQGQTLIRTLLSESFYDEDIDNRHISVDVFLPIGEYLIKTEVIANNAAISDMSVNTKAYVLNATATTTKKVWMAGGQRIKSIIVDDGDADHSNDIWKRYEYSEAFGGQTSGVLLTKPTFLFNSINHSRNRTYYNPTDLIPWNNDYTYNGQDCEARVDISYGCSFELANSNPVNFIETTLGSIVQYSRIYEFLDQSGFDKGYATYDYIIHADGQELKSRSFSTLREAANASLRVFTMYDSEHHVVSRNTYEYEYSSLGSIETAYFESLGLDGEMIFLAIGMDHDALKEQMIETGFKLAQDAVNLLINPANVFAMISGGIHQLYMGYLIALNVFNDEVSLTTQEDNTIYLGTTLNNHIDSYQYQLKEVRNEQFSRVDPSAARIGTMNYSKGVVANPTQPQMHSGDTKMVSSLQNLDEAETVLVKFSSDYIDQYPQDIAYVNFGPWSNNSLIQKYQNALGTSKALYGMAMANALNVPIETVAVKRLNGTEYVMGANLKLYDVVDDKIVLTQTLSLNLNTPILLSEYGWSRIDINGLFVMNPEYKIDLLLSGHDSFGAAHQYQNPNDIVQSVFTNADGIPLGFVVNATVDEIAFEGFEQVGLGWTYNASQISEQETIFEGQAFPDARTGKSSYILDGSPMTVTVPNGDFILSCWAKGEIAINYQGNVELSITEGPDELGWIYREYFIEQNEIPTDLTISGNCKIDELRLYPKDALMATTAIDDLGRVLSKCDYNSNINRVFYNSKGLPYIKYDHYYDVVAWTETELKDLSDEGHFGHRTIKLATSRGLSLQEVLNQNVSDEVLTVSKTYHDGLGRPLQNVGIDVSPDHNDVIQFTKYDKYGQTLRNYLPFTDPNPLHKMVSNTESKLANFYENRSFVGHTAFPYQDVKLDNTPMSHVIESGGIGAEWQLDGDHTTTIEMGFNALTDYVLNWRAFDNNGNKGASAMDNGQLSYWPVNTLTKMKYTDQNNKSVVIFSDVSGKPILKRIRVLSYGNGQKYTADLSGGGNGQVGPTPAGQGYRFVDIYYVYDKWNRLVYELPAAFMEDLNELGNNAPRVFSEIGGQNSNLFEKLVYAFRYDNEGRLIERKQPQVDWEYFVYNKIDQLVMSQDASQRILGDWSFARYDVLGRVVTNGVAKFAGTRELHQLNQDNLNGALWEVRYPMDHPEGYTHMTVYDATEVIFNNYYYDTYAWSDPALQPTLGEETELMKRMKGVPTGRRTRLFLEDPFVHKYLRHVPYYLANGNLYETMSELPDGGFYKETYDFNDQGQVRFVHSRNKLNESSAVLHQEHRYEYGHMGRLERVFQKIAQDTEVQTVWYQYNDLGQMIRKHLHLIPTTNVGMQIVDYRYNAQGWLTKINNADLGADEDNLEDFDAFGMELIYGQEDIDNHQQYQTAASIKPVAQFNGMLSAIQWKSKLPEQAQNEEQKHSYVYRYDDLYQLTGSYYAKENTEFAEAGQFSAKRDAFTETTKYNLRGGIVNMRRFTLGQDGNTAVLMDNLTYGYEQNSYRLKSVFEAATFEADWSVTHFRQGAEGTFSYDELGNVSVDPNKELSYQYNALGRVNKIMKTGETNEVKYLYTADGTLHQKQVGDKITYHSPTVQYVSEGEQDPQIEHVATAAGIARLNEIALPELKFFYDYYLLDHMGNLRVVVTTEGARQTTAQATMEMQSAYFEDDFFEHVPDSRVPKPLDYPSTEHSGNFVSGLKGDGIAQGPGKIIKVAYSDQVEVSTFSYYRSEDAGQTTGQTVAEIMADMLLNIAAVGQDIMPAGEAGVGQFINPSSPGSQSVSEFMTQELSDYDPSAPQAYLVYLFFDKNMKLHSKASGMLKVSQSDVLEEHATQQLTMTEDGYFYTYVTNRSNRKVEFDNLTITHLQGQIRARYDYYSYGLAWNQPINPYDNTYGLKEWQMQEWGDKGIELYQFEARMYDPVLGRWHAPDPLSQFHSPFMANFNNPANFTDPDGRFSMRIGDMIVQATVQLAISISQVDIFTQISNVTIGGTLNGAQFAAGASGAISGVLTVAMAIGGCIEGYRDIMQASISKVVDKQIPPSGNHTVQAGESYWSIENQYGLEHGSLAEYNSNVAQDQLKPGQQISLEPDLPLGEAFIEQIFYQVSLANEQILQESNLALPLVKGAELILATAGAITLTYAAASTQTGVATDTAIPKVIKKKVPQKFWYVTYAKLNTITGEVYVGRASGYGSSGQDVVNLRDRNHHMNQREPGWGSALVTTQLLAVNQLGGYARRVDDPSYWAIRGSEQLQIEYYRSMGMSANRINGINPNSDRKKQYIDAAKNLIDWFKY
jgi:RHS repeat-associated protein